MGSDYLAQRIMTREVDMPDSEWLERARCRRNDLARVATLTERQKAITFGSAWTALIDGERVWAKVPSLMDLMALYSRRGMDDYTLMTFAQYDDLCGWVVGEGGIEGGGPWASWEGLRWKGDLTPVSDELFEAVKGFGWRADAVCDPHLVMEMGLACG